MVHERKQREQAAEQDGDNWQAVLRSVGEDLWCLGADGQTVKDTGGTEEEGVASGERRSEDGCVNDGWERWEVP